MSEQMWFGILYVIVGLVLIGVSVPLLAGRISRNRWYGFRIRKSFASEETWLLINRYGARHLIRWSSVIAALGAYLLIAEDVGDTTVTWIALGAPLLMLIPVGQTLWYAKQLP